MPWEAAEIVSKNSGHKVSIEHLRQLVARGVLTPLRFGGRNFYTKVEVDGCVVKERRKSSVA